MRRVFPSWSRADTEQTIPLLKEPATLYNYPESEDIKGGGASRLGASAASVQPPLLDRRLPETNRRSEILVKTDPRTDPRAIPQGPGPGPQPRGDVQAVVLSTRCAHGRSPDVGFPLRDGGR